MRTEKRTRAISVLPSLAFAAAAMAAALPGGILANPIELATVPMANSTATTVRPNLMFVLDDSGSMDWDYLPDIARNFANKYGFNSSQCNGNYYNPNVTYTPPVNSTGAPLNATPTTFSAAYRDGFNTGAGTTDLSTNFSGGSGSGASGINLTPGPAFYYIYTGSQTTPAQQNYFNTSSTFYQECNSTIGSTPGSGVFTQVRLASTPTTTITVSGAGGGGATITINSTSSGRFNGITVNGFQIMSARTNSTSTRNTLAGYVVLRINACTGGAVGNCTTSGYSASAVNNVITITGPDSAALATPSLATSNVNISSVTAFPALNPTVVNSITVGATQLLTANASGGSANSLAADIRAKIGNGYTATVTSNRVTVTAPDSSVATLSPVITVASGGLTLATQPFPESDPAKLQNFANWYSYYSNRMLMMKTGAGLAFNNVADKYRVGFMSMNNNVPQSATDISNNVSPGLVEVGTFNAAKRAAWFSALYRANPANSTPLREALSKVGQYYAHLFGNITTYTARITVGGSGETAVEGITVNGSQIMEDEIIADASTSVVAARIASAINAKQVTDFGAKAVGNVVTITGPASASGVAPVVADDAGGMTFSVTTFTGTTTTATLNGVTPADPIQYSCQQNFTILSTDGYWNGPNTYDLAGNNVGQVDGTAPRPYNDGGQAGTTVTTTYTRNDFSSSASRISGLGGSDCTSGRRRVLSQPQIQSCAVTTIAGVAQPEVCTNWSNNGSMSYVSPYTSNNATCVSSGSIVLPSPDPSVRVAVSSVSTEGVIGGTPNTLADVALYYYQTDLRDPALGNCTGALGNSVCQNNVFISGSDNNLKQHMTTFTLGLGVRGRMIYSSSYLTDTTGDFVAVKLGSTASASVCTWQTAGTVCNWPVPTSGSPETTDDLWHAAVNGRGAFFSATDPTSLANGLANALTSISSKVGAAAAAATSTLNPVAGNNLAFVASYTTLKWTGNLEARGINTDTGAVSENATWCVENVAASSCSAPGSIVADTAGDTTAYYCVIPNSVTCPEGELDGTDCRVPIATACTGTMNSRVAALADTRVIKTANDTGNGLIDFDASYAALHPEHFNATVLAGLSQWPPAADTSATAIAYRSGAPGANLVTYLRGQFGHEYDRSTVLPIDQYYRNRESVLGDALESQPAFVGPSLFPYPYPGYPEYRASTTSRGGTVYMGTNDGMLHAFASDTGQERWAYVPSMVIPNMWKLADKQYADRHTNFVNGSPVTADICTANCANPYDAGSPSTNPVWKTILVAGLNGGGRGYYALDITNPSSPSLMWEMTTTAGIGVVKDDDLGYTFGQPVVTRRADGTWVVLVTSGYNNGTDSATRVSGSFVPNSPAGDGKGYLYVLNATTGAIISKISTGVGTPASPSGLAKIAGFNSEPVGNKVSYVYGGDLKGNLWRFDINDASTTAAIGTGSAFRFATLASDTAGTTPQPIMTTPVLGKINNNRVVFIGTGKYLEVTDLSSTQRQTQYGIMDDDATATLVNPRTSLVQQFLIPDPGGTATRVSAETAASTTTGANVVDFGIHRGWFFDFPESRERVNIEGRLIEGTLLIPSIVPSSTDCSPGGAGWLNFVDYRTGAAVDTTTGLTGVKFDSPIVGINVLYIDGKPVPMVVTADRPTPEQPPADIPFADKAASFSGKRVLWRELIP